MMTAPETLQAIADRVRVCQLCSLASTRKNAVPGVGSPDADIMLIGEGPGHHENEQGLPFVGAAGKLLDELLAGIGLNREDVYITNVIKCRPPGNRDPQPEEIDACRAYLDGQIAFIDPRVIVTLGRFSMARWFPGARISTIHGQPKRIGARMVVPMFHPAAALHQPKYRPLLHQDFKQLPGFIAQMESENGLEGDSDQSLEQLSLL
ncbi:MAG: uracil-DNA glycosylase [Anaerolineales bacterium]|jgi:DNA polymerase|nr:uracil-DNA glycosylase [Anaerolineales bacterium]